MSHARFYDGGQEYRISLLGSQSANPMQDTVLYRISLLYARCELGEHETSLEGLARSGGRCPECGAASFGVSLCKGVMKIGANVPEKLRQSMITAFGRELFFLGGDLAPRAPGISTEEAKCDVDGVPGADLLVNMKRPPEETWAWIENLRLSAARARLKPNQGICPICHSVFVRAPRGPTAEGFCSKMCQKQGVASAPSPASETPPPPASPVSAPAAPPAARAQDTIPVICGCGKRLRVRGEAAGKSVRCPACGKAIVVPQSGGETQAVRADAAPRRVSPAEALRIFQQGGVGFQDVASRCLDPAQFQKLLCESMMPKPPGSTRPSALGGRRPSPLGVPSAFLVAAFGGEPDPALLVPMFEHFSRKTGISSDKWGAAEMLTARAPGADAAEAVAWFRKTVQSRSPRTPDEHVFVAFDAGKCTMLAPVY